MKINKKAMMEAIKICSIIKNDSLPLWDSLLFQCQYGDVTITGRNATHILSHKFKAEDESSISPFLFKGSTLMKILKECPEDVITLTYTDKVLTLSFDLSSFDFHADILDAMDYINGFPLYGEEQASTGVPVYYIRDFAKAWSTFASTDELRPVMQHICIDLTDGAGYIVATNAHVLFRVKYEWYCDEPQTFLVPSKIVGKLCKLMPKQDIHLKRYEKNWSAMTVGNTSLLYYTNMDKYPNWKAVIPEDSTNTIHFLAMELRSAIRQLNTVSNPSTHQIILEATEKDGIQLLTHDSDFDHAGRVRLRRTIKEGDDLRIGFNSVLLLQCLDALTGKEITMTYTTPNRAVIFKGNDNGTLALLMPVMIN